MIDSVCGLVTRGVSPNEEIVVECDKRSDYRTLSGCHCESAASTPSGMSVRRAERSWCKRMGRMQPSTLLIPSMPLVAYWRRA